MNGHVSRPAAGPAAAGQVLPLGLVGRLTDRDRAICRLVWTHRVFTTEQLAVVFFDSLRAAQQRLRVLWRLGVLERFRTLQRTGSESWRYTLGPAGAALVAIERGDTPPRPAQVRAHAARLAAGARTDHTLGVNGLFCSLAGHARHHPSSVLVEWWSERRCAAEWGDLVRPDGYGIWTDQERSVGFFVEYDTGSEPLARVAAKLSGYADLALAEGIARPVLFWLASAGREPGLQQAIGRPPVPAATATVGNDPGAPVWLPTGGSGARRRLTDLAVERADRR
jgi:hypothetical protein